MFEGDFKSKLDINKYLCHVQKILDENLYGMRKAKEEILLIVNNMISNPNSKNLNLGLVGPPGVGKTEIMRCLAKALNLPFEQVSLGGAKDSSFLDGHSYTYVGATPGIIVKLIKKMGHKNGIMYFDEIDKLANTDYGWEVNCNLLHILDPTQNGEFRDKYLDELPVDLSHLWFVFSLNDEKNMDKVLKDRIHLVHVSEYDLNDKVQIAQNFLIPKALDNSGFKQDEVKFTKETIEHVVALSKSKEKGVRQLNRNLQNIIRRLNIYKTAHLDNNKLGGLNLSYQIPNFKLPYIFNRESIDILFREDNDDNFKLIQHIYT